MKPEEQTILLIEDNLGDIRLIKELLKEINSFHYPLIIAETLKEGCELIKKNNFILILLDLNLPDSKGKSTYDTLIKFTQHTPVVLVSGIDDLLLSVELIREGAQDFISKSSLSSLVLEKSITYSIERKIAEELQFLSNEVLIVLNSDNSLKEILGSVIRLIQQNTHFSAVGIRLKAGEDYPYFTQNGFPENFLITENSLTVKNSTGDICLDIEGKAKLECICGLVISGEKSPFIGASGSFWTNNSFPVFDLPNEEDPRTNMKNICVLFGYGSVALIPIRSNGEIVGLLQLNERRINVFNKDLIGFFEGICSSIGTLLLRKQAEELIKESKDYLHKIINSVASPIFVKDDKHKFCLVNEALCTLLCLPLENIIGTTGYEFLNEEQFKGFLEKDDIVLNTGVKNINEELFTNLNGIDRTIVTTKTLYTDAKGNKFLVGVITDITDRKQAENTIQNRIDELERFHKLVIGRELRMIELKKEINELSKKLGEFEDRYLIPE